MKPNEYGSDFPLETRPEWLKTSLTENIFIFKDASLVTSGREALLGILSLGIEKYNWTTVYFPSYYCHEVVDYISTLPLTIIYYNYNPFDNTFKNLDTIIDQKNVAFVNVNFFGLRELNTSFLKNVFIIDDYTYQIEKYKKSTSHYCFGSLRKELPVPVGGFCYSPRQLALPKFKKSKEVNHIASKKLVAMEKKTQYLDGQQVDKDVFRALYQESEQLFEKQSCNGSIDIQTYRLLLSLNIEAILNQKAKNLKLAREILLQKKIEILNVETESEGYGLIVFFKTNEKQNFVKLQLIKSKIFPAVLWPNQRHEYARILSEKMLLIHLDYRHSLSDVSYICKKLETICNGI